MADLFQKTSITTGNAALITRLIREAFAKQPTISLLDRRFDGSERLMSFHSFDVETSIGEDPAILNFFFGAHSISIELDTGYYIMWLSETTFVIRRDSEPTTINPIRLKLYVKEFFMTAGRLTS